MNIRFRNSIIDFLLYSHLFIALCAVSIALLSSLLYLGNLEWRRDLIFIFTSTLGLYGIHRLIGLQKIHDHLGESRFSHIKPFGRLLVVTIAITVPASLILFLQFDRDLQLFLITPIVLSLAYVLPIWKNRRLRDVSFIKIFIISVVWSMVSVGIPMWDYLTGMNPFIVLLMFFERFLFVLAITLPFDIRDLDVDRQLQVRTIPMQLGVKRTKKLSYMLLVLCGLLMTFMGVHFGFSIYLLLGYYLGLTITVYLIAKVSAEISDYYISGWVDGTMIILLATTLFGSWVSMTLS